MKTEILNRALEARDMLGEGHLFGEVWRRLDRECVTAWRAAAGAGERERLHQRQAALAELKAEFVRAVEAAAREEARENAAGEFRPFKDFLGRLRGKN